MNAIQPLIEQPASEQLQHEQAIAEIRAVTDSVALSLQAIIEQQATDRLRHEEVVSSRLTEVQLSMARMLSNIDQNQPSLMTRLSHIEHKVDQLLDRNPE